MSWLGAINGGGIKSVQRGIASGSGTVVINEVDMNKSFVNSISKGSAGYVAARGTVAAANITSGAVSGNITGTLSGTFTLGGDNGIGNFGPANINPRTYPTSVSGTRTLSGTMSGTVPASAISGGTTSLTVAEYGARLLSPNQITVDGACWWEVVEFY